MTPDTDKLVTRGTPCVVRAHGGGGELMQRLIRERFLPHLGNDTLSALTDGAVVPWDADRLAFTTDSFVVTPIEFPGGDIGRLAVCGTVNDLAMMGAMPVALSLGLILEEGLLLPVLDRVIASLAASAAEAGVRIVTGDTKVIERRPDAADSGLMINTAGIGKMMPAARLGTSRIVAGDAVLVSGPIAEHGLAILSVRNGLEFDSPLRSDAAPLAGLVAALLDSGADVKFLRDPTRGGVAGVWADVAEERGLTIEIDEERVPLTPAARQAAELLGLDPLAVANEGKLVAIVAGADRERAVAAMRGHPLGRGAVAVGRVADRQPPLVELLTRYGGRRIVQRPYGEELPRIC